MSQSLLQSFDVSGQTDETNDKNDNKQCQSTDGHNLPARVNRGVTSFTSFTWQFITLLWDASAKIRSSDS